MASDPRRPLISLSAKQDPADMWDSLVARGMSPDSATAEVAKVHGPPPGQAQPTGAGRTWDAPKRTLGQNAMGAARNFNDKALLSFGDEVTGGIAGLMPGGMSPSEAIQEEKRLREATPGAYKLPAQLAGAISTVALTAPLGFAKGGALLGAGDATGNAEGLKNRAIAAPIGGAAGAFLGKAGELVSRLGGRKVMTGLGALLGAQAGDSNKEHLTGAVAAGAGANLATRGGSMASEYLATNVVPKLTRGNGGEVVERLAQTELGRTLQRAGMKPGDISKMAEGSLPGTRLYHMGKEGGPLQSLARAAESIPSKGAGQIRETAMSSRLAPSAAEKHVRRALGSRYVPENPLVASADDAVAKASAPAYEAIAGKVVRNPEIFRTIESNPRLLDMLEEGAALSREEAAAGMSGAEAIPQLFERAEDGTVKWLVDEIPVRALDYMKRGADELANVEQSSKKYISRSRGRILEKLRGDLVKMADQEVPEYEVARRTYGDAKEKQVEGLTQRVAADRFVVGNSATARIQEAQDDLGATPVRVEDIELDPKKWLASLVNSQVGARLRGLNEAKVNALAPHLTKEMTPQGAAELDQLFEDFLNREVERRVRGGAIPRAASLGAGSLVGSSLRGKDEK